MNHTDPRPRGQATDFRPTLFGEDEDPAGPAGADGLRILGSLQPPPAPRRSRRGWWAAGGVLVAALAASAWLLARQAADAGDAPGSAVAMPVDTDLAVHQPSSAGPAAPQPAPASGVAPGSTPAPAPAASIGDAGPAPAPLAGATGAARIEADAPVAQAPAAVRDPFSGLAAGLAQGSATAATAAAGPAASAAGDGPRTARQAEAAARPTRVARAEPRAEGVSPRDAAKPPAAAAPVPAARRAADEDVELIEAVVSHGASRKRAPQPAARAASAGGRSPARDVVHRQAQAAESTSELLQRCDAVGGLEGVLCRWRICADRWGKDPACPKSSPRPYREPA